MGHTYELLNTLRSKDSAAILRQHNQHWSGKTTLASGGVGKIRFARNTDTDEIVIVKKVASQVDDQGNLYSRKTAAEHEIRQMQNLLHQIENQKAWHTLSSFSTLQDYAHLQKPVSASTPQQTLDKTYIFSEFAHRGDGTDAVDRLHLLTTQGKTQDAQRLLMHFACRYTEAVMNLHLLGFHHRDIKPDNFLHYDPQIPGDPEPVKLADFGFTTEAQHRDTWRGGTSLYLPPEAKPAYRLTRYDAKTHDCFSLGLSLLILKQQNYPHLNPNTPHLKLKTLDGKTHDLTLSFYRNIGEPRGEKMQCSGVDPEHLKQLDMTHFDNIVAKLLAKNKADRMTAETAFGLLSQLK